MKRSTGNYESQLQTFSLQPPFIKSDRYFFIYIYFFWGGGGGRGLAKRDSIENPLNDIGYFFLTISVDKLFFKAGQTSP